MFAAAAEAGLRQERPGEHPDGPQGQEPVVLAVSRVRGHLRQGGHGEAHSQQDALGQGISRHYFPFGILLLSGSRDFQEKRGL